MRGVRLGSALLAAQTIPWRCGRRPMAVGFGAATTLRMKETTCVVAPARHRAPAHNGRADGRRRRAHGDASAAQAMRRAMAGVLCLPRTARSNSLIRIPATPYCQATAVCMAPGEEEEEHSRACAIPAIPRNTASGASPVNGGERRNRRRCVRPLLARQCIRRRSRDQAHTQHPAYAPSAQQAPHDSSVRQASVCHALGLACISTWG